MLQFDIITIFPKIFEPVLNESIIKRAQEKKKVTIRVHDLRDYTNDKHRKVDDRPLGGGPGMVLMPQPIFDAVKKIKRTRKTRVILTSPAGRVFNQRTARRLSGYEQLIIICGHYEGIDDRVRQKIVDETISLGDYILTGGELAAMVLTDCMARLVPGVLGKKESLALESFEDNLLEYPQYTRPANFRGMDVPDVLLSGNHQQIAAWRKAQAILLTQRLRPDLLRIKEVMR